jgi:hypothetical protein
MRTRTTIPFVAALALLGARTMTASAADRYASFEAAIYARAQEVRQMGDLDRLRPRFEAIGKQVKVSKIYLETHRDEILVEAETVRKAKRFFEERGIRTAGGITLTIDERNRFQTFCYSDPGHRQRVQEIVEHTARLFDEIILDDFFFTSCKSDVEIRARGERRWTEYRLALLDEAARNLILAPARRVNPRVRVIVKYPNWYDHFHGLGFNLETGPRTFDAIYTGTETRDPVRSAQHLQPYHGYHIFRFLESLRPGHNAGGWVDTFGSRHADRYAEQLWLTLLAKAPEITLFDFGSIQMPVSKALRAPWQGQGTSFDFDAMAGPFRTEDGSLGPELTWTRVAGWSLEKIDPVIGRLGQPVGVQSYKPYHSTGEDFLHTFMGMVGIPIDLRPEFPADSPLVLLTAAAAHDPAVVSKIERQLRAGRSVLVTSGLLAALRGKGIERIAELEVLEPRALVEDFRAGWGEPVKSRKRILLPQLRYFTNDSWSLVDAVDGPMGWPLLHDAEYGGGHLYVWTIPDNPADLYALPVEVLNAIRRIALQGLDVRMDGPAEVSLFLYDNGALVVESFRDEATEVSLVVKGAGPVRDLETGEVLSGRTVPEGQGFFRSPDAGRTVITVPVKPHSYRAFARDAAEEPGGAPVNPRATPEARRLLAFLREIQGKHTLAGQHNFITSGSRFTERIRELTGKRPLLWGSDFSFAYRGDEPSEFQHCGPLNLTEPGTKAEITGLTPEAARDRLVKNAVQAHRDGHVVTLMWHACPPGTGDTCDGKAIWTLERRPPQEWWDELTTDGTKLNEAWKAQADVVAGYLKQLRDAGVPVLWRPYHEMNGVWFWWCNRKGENGFRKLWVMMYERYVKHHRLDNLIWVWNANAPRDRPGDEAFAYEDFWPGHGYVDVLAADVYRDDWKPSHHDDLAKLARGKPIAVGECAPPPARETLAGQPRWVWYMPWGNLVLWGDGPERTKALLADPRVLTREDVTRGEGGAYRIRR